MRYEENDERKSRINKILLTTAGVVAGGVLLKKKGNMEYLTKAFGDISHTMSKVARDINITERKDLTAEKIEDIFRRNISAEDSVWKVARRNTTTSINLNENGLVKDLLKMKNLEKEILNINNQKLDAEVREDIMNSFSKKFKDIKDRDKDFMKQLYVLTDESLRRQDSFFEKSLEPGKFIANREMINDFTKGTALEKHTDEIANVLEDALSNVEEIENKMQKVSEDQRKDIKDFFGEYMKENYKLKNVRPDEDRAATLNEVWEAIQEKKISLKQDVNTEDVMELIEKSLKEDPSLGELAIDPKTFRIDNKGQFYSLQDIRKTGHNMADAFSDTIPGKLFGVKNFVEENNAPNFFYMAKGSFDPVLANLQGGKDLLNKDMIYLGNKFYTFEEDGLKHFEKGDNLKFISGRSGTKFGLLDRIVGNSAYRSQDNKILNKLDVMTKGGNFLSEFKSRFTKFDSEKGRDWERNLIKRIIAPFEETPSDNHVNEYYEDLKSLSKLYNQKTFGSDLKTINKLKSVLSEDAVKLLETLESNDTISSIKSLDMKIKNKDLKTIIKRIENNPNAKDTMTRSSGNTLNKNILKYKEILNREVLKEALLKDAETNSGREISGYAITLSKIKKAELTGIQENNLKDLMSWGLIQKHGKIYSNDLHYSKDIIDKTNTYLNVSRLFNGVNTNAQENAFLKEIREGVIKFGKDNTSLTQSLEINPNNINGYNRNQWMTIKKAVNPLDIIESINRKTKGPSTEDLTKDFLKQFVAGRKNVQDITDLTFLPYHFVNRLMTPLEGFGLGFSNESTSDVLRYAGNIGLKRILPIAGAAFVLSYLNDESRNITGTSMSAAYQNAKAQFGVGLRTVFSPLDGYLDRQRIFNPIANYWLGDHKDKEEYLDYLEYGYDPVRKGRFWSFGSSSEFRGGKISYFEPNKLRQAHSNYRDIAIYGSSDEKWAHSIIPTPTHPFSTIRYLMNPYWLEDKHYEDRPYPVTGKMFTEGTPWGAILNPTLGELIKPKRRMHQKEMGNTMLDVRSIISNLNRDIKSRAQENRLVRIDESGATPMMFSPDSMPTSDEAIYTIKVDKGRVVSAGFEGQNYAETMKDASQAAPAKVADGGEPSTAFLKHGVQRLNSSGTYDNKMVAGWLSGIATIVSSGSVDGGTAVKMIEQLNQSIKDRAVARAENSESGEWLEKANLYKEPYLRESYKEKQEHLESMISFEPKKDYVHDMIYSTKQLSGMYGFLFDQILPQKHGYKLEQAGNMYSFSRQFWDESVGGLGGGIMEIARRFFPHEDHNITQLNPIRNTQEEWLPERFLTGDPYAKLPKGEARLPGPGYESLNKLHPDQYGRYGAFDRYKILADIAPLSEEYKLWKKIAKDEVKDPFLKKQMEEIDKRAKAQIQNHEFYDYKFLGKKMNEETVVIKEMSNTGKFSIVGSDRQFDMAGIKVLKDKEGESQIHNYLKPGMKVNIKYENNKYDNVDSQGNISAIVSVGGTNVNKEMVESGAAKEKDTKETLADELYGLTNFNMMSGHVWEAIGHLPIPIVHNKFMRIDSALESYRKEQVYGTSYSTWDHPIKGYLKPAFQQAFAANPLHQALGVGAFFASEYFKDSGSKGVRQASATALALLNPGALAGGIVGALPKMSLKDKGIWNARNGARIGAVVGFTGYALHNTQNPYLSMANFAAIGFAAQRQLKFKGINDATGALIGAGVGLALSGLNPKSKLTNIYKKYIPEDTEKKWEIEEYYDRIEYLKYQNLFKKAARLAKRKEGVDINRIINQYERNKEKNAKIIEKLEERKKKANRMIDEKAKNMLIASINQQISELQTPIQYLKAGKYTKAALAYKKASDTTIYGLSKDATTADVLRALPKYDRDYFLDFAKEKDPKKRKKILQYVSPYKAKALKILWKEDYKEPESNRNFFNNHNLPNLFWSGWEPQVDLDNVKMKTIENEGMMLSDFGMYDSAENEPAVINAPEIKDIHHKSNTLSMQTSILGLLNGAGFSNVDVSVEPTRTPGVQMIANVSRLATYNIGNRVSSALNTLLF